MFCTTMGKLLNASQRKDANRMPHVLSRLTTSTRALLPLFSAERIFAATENDVMINQARPLASIQRHAVAEGEYSKNVSL
jgi:hypothetical protein